MAELFKVSQSKVGTWRRCRYAYHNKYVEKLIKKVKSRPLKFGTIIHEMVEAEAKNKNPFKLLKELAVKEERLFDAEREMYGNLVEDIQYIMTAYFDYWDKEPLIYLPVKKQLAEHEFAIEIVKGEILAKGKIDAFAKYKKKLKVLIEHKSHKNIPNEEHRWRNMQSVIYIRITDMLGWGKLDGTLWDYIRSKPPTRPEILKSGKLSERSLDSLPQVVEDVIKANKLARADYTDLIDSQVKNQDSYFQRIFTPASKSVISNVFSEFVETSKEMMALHGKAKQKTFGQHCTWCDYRHLCAAELRGHDVDFIKEREFMIDGQEPDEEEPE